jgi:hypothetical protein
MSNAAQEAFAKVENLRSQHPNDKTGLLIKLAGVSAANFYKGKKMAASGSTVTKIGSGKRANPKKAAAETKNKPGRKPGRQPSTPAIAAAVPARQDDKLIALVGTVGQIRDFLAGRFA